jgi:hypothetical protein
MCHAGDFNLSYKSLMSLQMLDALRKLSLMDPEFFAELIQAGSSDILELPKEIIEDKVPELDNDDLMGDGNKVPLAIMVKCVAGDDIGEDFARNEEGGMDSTLSVEGVEEDPFEGEVIEPISMSQDAQKGHGRHTKKPVMHFQGPN